MKYPNNLREIRKKLNVNANDLAALLEVTFQHYYALERGERQLSAKQITALSSYLKVTADEILGEQKMLNDNKSVEQNGDIPVLDDPHVRAMARRSLSKDPNKQALLKKLITSMLEED